MTYAFVLDASACSGCKACQAACKDKNQLPLGVLWRRVYEVSGGEWKQAGAAWTNTLFAYNLSLSCNHCEHPKCAGVCPVDAYTVREDGIVILDWSKCIGCGYCAWACPYGAPQYDRSAGRMTKCDLCYDNLDAGLPPACVAACPLRALDLAEVGVAEALPADRVALWDGGAETHPYPMPTSSRTRPHLVIKPHAAMSSTLEKTVANREEIQPRKLTGWEEAPLVVFTLLTQMSIGGFWAMLWLAPGLRTALFSMLMLGICLGAGMLASFAHLGTKRNAWRVLNHLRKSWLSREIFFTLLFGAGWLGTLIAMLVHADIALVSAVTALLGLLLLHCMGRVYRLRAVPAWDSWKTEARFFLSAALLGILAALVLQAWMESVSLLSPSSAILLAALLLAQAALTNSLRSTPRMRMLYLRLVLAALFGCAAVFSVPAISSALSASVLLLVVLAEEAAARLLFYQARV